MNWQFTPYAIPLVVSAWIMLMVTAISWQRRTSRGAFVLLLLSLCVAIYQFAYAGEIGSLTPEAVLTWLKLEYMGITVAPVLLLILVVHYTDQQRHLSAIIYVMLLAVPIITISFALTNERHELIWHFTKLDRTDGYTRTIFEPGTWYWVQIAYSNLFVFLAIVALIRAYRRVTAVYRRQIVIFLIAVLIPEFVYLIYLSRLILPGLDINPYGMTFSTVLITWNMFQYRFMDLMPIAREEILQGMDSGIIVLDADERLLYINNSAQQILGVSPETAIGQPFTQYLTRWSITAANYQDHDHLEISIELGGVPHFFDLHQTPITAVSPQQGGRLILLTDITDRVKAERALEENNDRLLTLRQIDAELTRKLSVEYVAQLAMDASMRITYADSAFIGLAEGDAVRVVQTLGNYAQQLPRNTRLDKGISARTVRQRQAELVLDVTKDTDYLGIVPTTHSQMSLPLISGEKTIGVITLETAKENRFTPEMFETVKLLASRTAIAIDNARMYEDREKLIKELEAFAHTVAHDLKNPLGTIMGFAEFILEDGASLTEEEKVEYVESILHSANKSIEIIQALLMLAGVRTKETLQLKVLDMNVVLKEVKLRMVHQLEASEAQIIQPENWLTATGYAPWVEEIWANYISNAIKYGGKPPRIELGYSPTTNGKVRFWVRDNGSGIAAEEQAQLFHPFTRLGRRDVEGHGLGLSIVQHIVERLNGEVGVESEEGKGSLFYFTLPTD